MSRFFAVSDSESESSSSKEEQIPQKQQGISSRGGYKELLEIQKLIKNHKKIRVMSKLLSSFDDLTRAFVKDKNFIDIEKGGKMHTLYIRTLVELKDFITECWEDKEGRKNMSKNSFKSLTTLRQRFRLNPEDENEEKEEAGEQDESSDDDDDKPMDFLEKDPKPEKEDTKSKLLKGSDDDDSEDEDIEWGSFSEDEDIEWGSFFKFIFF